LDRYQHRSQVNQCSEAYLSEIKEYQAYQEKVKEANKDNKVFKYNIPIGGETQFTINDSNRGRILGDFFNIWYGMLMINGQLKVDMLKAIKLLA
jgi:hypothetical protein